PACTLLHLGPGFANGLANLHNAYRARTPIISIVGQHASGHLKYDTPLTSDIEAFARPYSGWLRTSRTPAELGGDAADAIVAALRPRGRIATLIVPADVAWSDGGRIFAKPTAPQPSLVDNSSIETAARMLRSGAKTALLMAGNALYGRGLTIAGRI